MIATRRTGSALTAVLLGAALLGVAAPLAPATAAVTAVPVGHLAFITTSGELDVASVSSDGTTTPPERIGPVTTVQAPNTVAAAYLVASGDGQWLAWSETISKPSKQYGSIETGAVLAIRNMTTGKTSTLRSEDEPLGFAGDQLVVSGAHTARLAMTPQPHLVRIREGNAYPVGAYPRGIVDVKSVGSVSSSVDDEQLRLTTFSGRHTVLHEYRVGRDYRSVTANFDSVSPDGKVLLVERGNHQDFDGLGPSSLFDEFSLAPGHARTQLGHYGTNAADWRQATETFVGADDTPWLALHSGYTKTSTGYAVRGVVVSYTGGHWKLEMANAIDAAGTRSGYVVVQPGTWVPVKNSVDGEYDVSPTGPAVLRFGSTSATTSVEGTQLLWVG